MAKYIFEIQALETCEVEGDTAEDARMKLIGKEEDYVDLYRDTYISDGILVDEEKE